MKTARMVFCTAVVVWLAAVFAWAELQMRLIPRSLNVNSKGQYFKCHLWDPEGDIDVSQIAVPVTMMICNNGIVESEEGRNVVDGDVLTVYFLREDIQAAVDGYPDRAEVDFCVSGFVGGGDEVEVFYDSEADKPGGIPLGSSVSWVMPGGYSGAGYFNVSQLSGSVIFALQVKLGGVLTVLYLGGSELGAHYALPDSIDWTSSVTVWVFGTAPAGSTIGFSITDLPAIYGEEPPTGGESFEADDVIRVLRKDRGKKK